MQVGGMMTEAQALMEKDTVVLNEEYIRWEKNRARLAGTFSNHQSVTSLASNAVSCSLISAKTLQQTVCNTNETFTNEVRANMLIVLMSTKVISDPSIFETFLGSLDDCFFVNIKKHLRDELKKAESETHPEAAVLLKLLSKLVEAISLNLDQISAILRANYAITQKEHDMILFPQNHHTATCLNMILTEIGEAIRNDPEKLAVFVEMLKGMDPYYKDICGVLTPEPIHL